MAEQVRGVALRPEDELLVCCARTSLEVERAARVRTLAHGQIDWGLLLEAARRHGLMPLLYHHLSGTCSDVVPAAVLEDLHDRFRRNAGRNLVMASELEKTIRLLAAHNISAIPYKGPILAASVYGDLGLREFGDLDILVRKRDVRRAKALLLDQGYQVDPRLTPAQEAAYLDFNREYTFTSPDGKHIIEIQWGFAARYYCIPLDHEQLWARLQPASVAGWDFPSLCPEDLLLVLCVHGFQHVWERLEWVCGVAELIRRQSDLDWQQVLEWAGRIGCERILLLGVFLASDLLGASLPDAVARKVRADRSVPPLAGQVYHRLFAPAPNSNDPGGGERLRAFHLKARERLPDRLRCCYHQLVTPYIPDWSLVPLPSALFPLYYLVRPIRLIAKHAFGLGRSAS